MKNDFIAGLRIGLPNICPCTYNWSSDSIANFYRISRLGIENALSLSFIASNRFIYLSFFFFENEIISHEIVREKRYRIFDKIKLFFERIYISSWWKTTLEFFKILLNNFLITVREERKEERISWKSWAKEVGEKKYRIAPSVFPKSLNLIRRTPFLLVERFIGRNETRCCFVFS